ncbi:MAG TPA: glycerol-3-phosphate 1-O-acyltransferase [Nitrospirae bacterium]|nr:glycerol-3-phosphate acyltransferase [bacterium BMS3Abin10]GBE38756.1 glycerol-3-phosphate acyltransferase [bacterium BMS3Bbin08]HDH50833.1 glycerol-3-phosphate 1-O-acyltransferase [Nitrospirota bacterium]HDK17432.1 glycerol-3-phosphate 1-O-acyltransferase [Nitrospirota bacterium]HDK81303.1 glycerol-3-phosphate 1-O-acyltransferase [Nitrospirota bacterium]
MNDILLYLLIPTAYIMGSVPFGVLVAKAKGIDLQKTGSRNIGATNVMRTVGKWPALLTLLGDSLKGAAAVMLCRVITGGELWESITGIAVVLGHMYPVFLGFRGGKGVATGLGVLAVYSPVSALILVAVWIFTFFLKKYSSLAALAAFASLPVVFVLSGASVQKIFFAIALAFLIILKHRENIERLIKGTEPKIGTSTGN